MILIRHGESEFNVHFNRTRVDPGIRDPALTEAGRQQALAAAERLLDHDVGRLLASPYRRALETAHIIAERLGLSIAVEPLVRERCAFVCDIGSERSRLAESWPHLDFDHVEERWWPDAEESEHRLGERCGAFRLVARGMADWHRVAVVSHWGFIRGLTGRELRNGELIRFDPHAGD
jgi:broad specificity phosphatase PhoE